MLSKMFKINATMPHCCNENLNIDAFYVYSWMGKIFQLTTTN